MLFYLGTIQTEGVVCQTRHFKFIIELSSHGHRMQFSHETTMVVEEDLSDDIDYETESHDPFE